jgi:hypothetical protein
LTWLPRKRASIDLSAAENPGMELASRGSGERRGSFGGRRASIDLSAAENPGSGERRGSFGGRRSSIDLSAAGMSGGGEKQLAAGAQGKIHSWVGPNFGPTLRLYKVDSQSSCVL